MSNCSKFSFGISIAKQPIHQCKGQNKRILMRSAG